MIINEESIVNGSSQVLWAFVFRIRIRIPIRKIYHSNAYFSKSSPATLLIRDYCKRSRFLYNNLSFCIPRRGSWLTGGRDDPIELVDVKKKSYSSYFWWLVTRCVLVNRSKNMKTKKSTRNVNRNAPFTYAMLRKK